MKKIGKIHDKYLALLFLFMLIVAGVLFSDFIVHKRLYIFYDIGGDTRQSYWPMYKYLYDAILNGTLKSWSFQIGLGTSTFTLYAFLFDPFFWIILLFPVHFIPYGILVVTIMKLLISGYLFYLYINIFQISKFPAVISSLIWAFNGYMMLWGQHYWFATMLVFFTFLMFSVELWRRGKNPYLFPVSIALLGINSPYFLFMISIFLFFYVTFHFLLSEKKIELGKYINLLIKFFGLYFLGLGAAAVVFLPVSYLILSSPRINGTFITSDIFQLATYKEYTSIFLRMFSNNTLGIGMPYFGSINYYEGPMLSSSLLLFLMVPQLMFLKTSSKNKIIIYAIITLCLLSLIFPFFSNMFSAFSSFNYRWNFFIIFIIVFSIGFMLKEFSQGSKVSYLGIILSTLIVIVGWYLSYKIMQSHGMIPKHYLDIRYLQGIAKWIAGFLILYTLIIMMIHKNLTVIWIALTVAVSGELIVMNYPTINERLTVPNNVEEKKEGYYDYSNEAIDYIKEIDQNLYRIDKNYVSYSNNDSLFQDYNGVKSYNSLNNPSYFSFLQVLDTEFNNHNIISGFNRRNDLRNLVGVKYVLSKDDEIPQGYKKLKSFHGVTVFKNPYALPMGFTYDSYISEKDFEALSPIEKDETLMHAVVINKKIKPLNKYQVPKNTENNEILNISVKNGKITKQKGKGNFELHTNSADPNIILSLPPHEGQWKIQYKIKGPGTTNGQIFWKNKSQPFTNTKMFNLHVTAEWKSSTFDLNSKNINQIRIDPGELTGIYKIKNLKVQPINYKEDKKAIKDLKENSLHINRYTNSSIDGEINLSKKKMLFVSIPYDKGWRVKIDNKAVPTLKVNEGFVGVMVPKGKHHVELEYHQPFLRAGLIISILSWGLLLSLIANRLFKKRYSSSQ
ncbi:YfhO family protein [Neobacillus terrae]|uniref:YfhO family protein n=1 Tax=Neobacillus terrae TaxID=3034837 RepID=UPI00140AA8F4|nr:YfhO family protein [Neobacillus terrae]NHM30005.1 YfhO family protein [Neobacillus terrae]